MLSNHSFSQITWDRVLICLNEADTDTTTLWTCQDHSENIFRRINNAYVGRLALRVSEECLRHLYHLRANVSDLQCQVRALRINGASVRIDNALVDFVCLQLKPQVYEMVRSLWSFLGLLNDYAKLFTQNAVRGIVAHTEYEVSKLCLSEPSIQQGNQRNFVCAL